MCIRVEARWDRANRVWRADSAEVEELHAEAPSFAKLAEQVAERLGPLLGVPADASVAFAMERVAMAPAPQGRPTPRPIPRSILLELSPST